MTTEKCLNPFFSLHHYRMERERQMERLRRVLLLPREPDAFDKRHNSPHILQEKDYEQRRMGKKVT